MATRVASKQKAPALVPPGEGKTSNIFDVVVLVLTNLRSEFFSSDKDAHAAIPLKRTLEDAGYKTVSGELMNVLKRLGVCVQTGTREGRGGPFYYAVWTPAMFKTYHSPQSVAVAWKDMLEDRRRDSELTRLRRKAAQAAESKTSVSADVVVPKSTLVDIIGNEQAAQLTKLLTQLEGLVDTKDGELADLAAECYTLRAQIAVLQTELEEERSKARIVDQDVVSELGATLTRLSDRFS